MRSIDINCDMGEHSGFDADIMPLISSCNIACGGHTGNVESIEKTVELAIQHDVAIGAHPSYPDKKNFGRKTQNIPNNQLKDSLKEQVKMVLREAERQQGMVCHLKPHGALYNDLKKDREKAEVVVTLIEELGGLLTLMVPPQSAVKDIAQDRGLPIKVEGFADRTYENDFSLRSRHRPEAVITDKERVLNQVLDMIEENGVRAADSTFLTQKFDTICVHSDTPNSLAMITYLSAELSQRKIVIEP